ncbi:putative zinc-binding protein [Gallaecimonas sp. GXIMD4217]|uniref:putative zinc-binding protein n=1 Tax=Gallaecimonas sp. GXIMD4217 TaxID=3131927 RepID=UPI00311B1467
MSDSKPLVYSCSGCSNVAQLANELAVTLDRQGLAQMSCIAGVGGNVRSLVRTAQSGRPILAIDGCPLNCVRACLANHGVEPDQHVQLNDLGLKKRDGESCTLEDSFMALAHVQALIEVHFSDGTPGSADPAPAGSSESPAPGRP